MARLEAQARMGFYAAEPEAIAELVKHLVPAGPSVFILDPCAGEGDAIMRLAESIGVPQSQVYCIELDPERGDKVREAMPKAQVLAPCSFFSTSMMPSSFGLIYANPPFDHQLGGGGREETEFARACYRLLAPGGVLVLIAQFDTFRTEDLCVHLDCFYKDTGIYRFPDDHRPFHECAFIGIKRNVPIGREQAAKNGLFLADTRLGSYGGNVWTERNLAVLGGPQYVWIDGHKDGEEEAIKVWSVPECRPPQRFAKAGYTDDELFAAVAESPLNELVMGIEEPPIKEPPLPLAEGHVALLLAAGALDGLVETPDGNHVVRGVATKIEVYNEEASEYSESDDGKKARIKDVFSEQITLKVRALDRDGTIYTFTPEAAKAGTEAQPEEQQAGYADWELIQKLKMVTVANGAAPGEEAAAKARLKVVMERSKKRQSKRKTGS